MECIVAYALLALFIDLLQEIISTGVDDGEDAQWVNRRLWSNTYCDCRTVMPADRLFTRSQPEPVKPSRQWICSGKARSLGFLRLITVISWRWPVFRL